MRFGYIAVLTWAFYFLATHEDAQEKVVNEIKDVLGDDDVTGANANDLVWVL